MSHGMKILQGLGYDMQLGSVLGGGCCCPSYPTWVLTALLGIIFSMQHHRG